MSTETNQQPTDRVTLRRYGGDWQPLLAEFSDAVAALTLPDTAWAVLSCPIDGMDLADDFIALIDRDNDGRVRADDVRVAVRWTADMLRDWRPVSEGHTELDLQTLSEHAKAQRDTGSALAEKLGHAGKQSLTLADLHNTEALCQCGDRDGDGVVPLHCVPPALAEAAAQVITVCEPETDRHGKPGITEAVLERFIQARDAWFAWREIPGPHLPWGDRSVELAEMLLTCDAAVRAWFLLCEHSKHAPGAIELAADREIVAMDPRNPDSVLDRFDAMPIAPVLGDADKLSFETLYPGRLLEQLRTVRTEVFGDIDAVSHTQWTTELVRAQNVKHWHDEGAALPAGALSATQLEALDDETVAQLRQLCQLDAQNQQYLADLLDLEKLLIYQRDLFRFCRNFMALTDLLIPEARALFERGTLILGGRQFTFAMRVRDLKAHKPLAEESGIFVIYAQVSYRYTVDDEAVIETVAVPVTRGTADGLFKSRRGVFVDRQGRYHEAVIVDLVENPVSLQEALLAPFERIGDYLSGKLENWSKKLESDFDKKVTEVSKTSAPAMSGMNPLMGGTVALAALSSAFAFVTKQLADLGGPKILLALVIVCLLIMVPTVLLASVRLYRRNLAGLIAASGWALNDRMRLTTGLGRLFTRRPPLPKGAVSLTRDLVTEQLNRVDPGSAWRTYSGHAAQAITVLTLLVSLFAVAMPRTIWPWLDATVAGMLTLFCLVLTVVLLESFRLKRFRRVFLWPVLATPIIAVVAAVYALGST